MEEKKKKIRLPGIPISWALVIVAVVLAIGVSMVEISINQQQKNDQSQDVTQNTITKTVVVNIVEKNRKMKGLVWDTKHFEKYEDIKIILNDLEPWQSFYAKLNGNMVVYPVVLMHETIFTNKNTATNVSSTYTTNTMKIKNTLFEKVKGWILD